MTYRETSREAWSGFTPDLSSSLDTQIIAALTHVGRATCQEVEIALDRTHQAVSGNMRHLAERHIVRPSGHFGVTKSGRRAIMWELVPVTERVALVETDKALAAKASEPVEPNEAAMLQIDAIVDTLGHSGATFILAHYLGLLVGSVAKPFSAIRSALRAFSDGLSAARSAR